MLLLALLLAVGTAALVLGLMLAVQAGMVSLEAEIEGRQGLADADHALTEVRRIAWTAWGPGTAQTGEGWTGSLAEVADTAGAVLYGTVVPPLREEGGRDLRPWGYAVGAAVESGADGLDLPQAAIVADGVRSAADRASPLVELGSTADGPASVHTRRVVDPVMVGDGVSCLSLEEQWRLDAGTLALAVAEAGRPGTALLVLAGDTAGWRRLPQGGLGGGPETPVLVVTAGGAGLDLRGLGDLWGVVVVDDGGVCLDGTRLHGAVLASGEVDLGSDGQVLWSAQVHRWATDRSLRRTRLVPGSRVETLLP